MTEREEQVHSSMISVRLPADVEAALRDEATKSGETLSELIRSRLRGRENAERSTADLRTFAASVSGASAGFSLEGSNEGTLVVGTSTPHVELSINR